MKQPTCHRQRRTAINSKTCGGPTSSSGYTPARDYSYLAINRALRTFHEKHIIQIISQLSTAGARIYRDPTTDLLKVNEEFTTSLSLARCREVREADHRWIVRFDTSLNPDITIAARMAPGNTSILDYYVFPSMDVLANRCRLARDNGFVIDVYRTTDLSPLLRIARTVLLSKRLRRRGPEH